ncbi:MAG: DMT family transporter [Pseudomonadota bacterium]
MSETIVALAGTPRGETLALILALLSAFAHAAFGALQKGKHDPWLTRGAIDASLVLLALPIALFAVPWPRGIEWAVLAGAAVIHFVYKLLIAMAYTRAAYTVVYPVVRGTGPVVTVLFAGLVFGEQFTALQWLGVALVSGAILSLSLVNLGRDVPDPRALRVGILLSLIGGVSVAAYTTYDAYGIRLTPDPFTFLAWFFVVTSLDFPVIAWIRRARMARPPSLGPLAARGVIGALVAFVSFGGVMLATRLDKVGEAAVLRETSTVFAALIGWLVLREEIGPLRAALMILIACGAVLVEIA